MYDFLSGTRAKPWDDRELDVLEGFKFISFVLCTISQTAFMLFYTTLIDLLSIFTLLRRIEVTQFIASNLGLETFVFVSAFLGAYRAFQIMEAKNETLNSGDIMKFYIRKFMRLAPAYYGMWALLWSATSRIGQGAIWHNTDISFEKCKDEWLPTLLMIGNLAPSEMNPYEGCYQFAWPLQIDM